MAMVQNLDDHFAGRPLANEICYNCRMRTTFAVLLALLCDTAMAKGLACGRGAMSPMEARLERALGNKDAESTRIQNAQKASAKIQRSVPKATPAPSGSKTTYKTVSKPCCNSRQTITASGGGKVGVGRTRAEAAAAAQTSKAGSKATW